MQRLDAGDPRPERPDVWAHVLHVLEHPPATVIWLTLTAATVVALKALGL